MIYYVLRDEGDRVICKSPRKKFEAMFMKSVLPFEINEGDFFECIDNEYRKIAEQIQLDLMC